MARALAECPLEPASAQNVRLSPSNSLSFDLWEEYHNRHFEHSTRNAPFAWAGVTKKIEGLRLGGASSVPYNHTRAPADHLIQSYRDKRQYNANRRARASLAASRWRKGWVIVRSFPPNHKSIFSLDDIRMVESQPQTSIFKSLPGQRAGVVPIGRPTGRPATNREHVHMRRQGARRRPNANRTPTS